jgi:uncharacterized phage infection (PIP) family protein YhgE
MMVPEEPMTIEIHIHDNEGSDPGVLAALVRLENQMTDLTTAVNDLRTSVQDVSDRVNAGLGPLQAALSDSQQALTDFQAADTTEDANFQASIDLLQSSLNTSLAAASQAASDIEGQVAVLNQIAATAPAPAPAAGTAGQVDANGNPVPVTGDQAPAPVATDASGNPVDANGNPIVAPAPGDVTSQESVQQASSGPAPA